jgi:hypothetical protein
MDASDYPLLYPGVCDAVVERYPRFKWHSHATSPRSSQAFCLSAFVPLWSLPAADAVLDEFISHALPAVPSGKRHWAVEVEFESPEVLRETGAGQPTSIDVLLLADDVVVCVESKFISDAAEGLGRCRQPGLNSCEGFHGRGSDSDEPDVRCRLDAQDGDRDPRAYWTLAPRYLTEEALREQVQGERCPLLGTYQLMRNHFFAAEWAERNRMAHHAAIVLAPSGTSDSLSRQVEEYRALLLPEERPFVAFAPYEDYIAALSSVGGREGGALADFLTQRIGEQVRAERFTWHAGDVVVRRPDAGSTLPSD